MQSLKDLIDQNKKQDNVQQIQAKKVQPDEVEWIMHKNLIEKLSSDYVTVLKEKLSKSPRDVNVHQFTTKSKNVVNITVELPELSKKFDTCLTISEVDGSVQQVRYMAFKSSPAIVCVKTIVGR